MADQNITALPVATSPASSDQLLIVGATEEKLIDYEKLADAILAKLTSTTFALDQGTKSLVAALNELNSKASRFNGNIKKVGFRSGQRALNNIYLDFYDSNNSRTSLAFTTDGENAIKFLVNDEEKWKVVVK